jgi:hypothetical protein
MQFGNIAKPRQEAGATPGSIRNGAVHVLRFRSTLQLLSGVPSSAVSERDEPARLETASATLQQSLAELLGSKNPCAIPEKDLKREIKRCKKCSVFSGSKVTMQVTCGGAARLIRSDILDRDMFDAAAHTPENTA